jgi:DNA replication and repair protein RecF
MAIRSVELTNFRSYENIRYDFDPAVTLIVGPNASGKTNLLESLYVLAVTRSFRARDRELVRHEQDHFRIVAKSDEAEYALALSVANGSLEKRVTHDDVKQTLVKHIGQLQVTLFEPTDLDLVSGPPEVRRKYLDFLLSQTDRDYLKTLTSYKRVLHQRNALLEGFDIERLRREVFAWDVQLTELATRIHERRTELVAVLNKALPAIYGDIAGTVEPLELEYLSSIKARDYGTAFMEALTNNLTRDLGAGFTTIGPHRDDFKVHFKNNDIMSVASRGETRTVVLACKLAELSYAEEVTGIRPLLLLDDVFSELDHDRRTYLTNRLSGYQTIITTTDADSITRQITTPHTIINMDKL